ncbi:MAG: hypothetical protein F4W91_11420 [Gemmatimonadetes bacterium]|nr:hypothetical protein [Gemmatimonadota bacterium]
MKSRMMKQLRSYFDSVGISANNFRCCNYEECKAGNPNFVEATEPYIGIEYEKNTLPRVLFLSLDPGSADSDPNNRTTKASRKWMANFNPLSLRKGQHWYETHELAWKILRKFLPDLQFRKVGPYFAHTNCAKCCENNPNNSMASNRLFENCRQFIPREIEILSPDILVTQGNSAKWVVEYEIYENEQDCYNSAEQLETGVDCCKVYIIIIGDKKVVWIHTYHPRHGRYWNQKRDCFEGWTDAVYEYLTYHGRGND